MKYKKPTTDYPSPSINKVDGRWVLLQSIDDVTIEVTLSQYFSSGEETEPTVKICYHDGVCITIITDEEWDAQMEPFNKKLCHYTPEDYENYETFIGSYVPEYSEKEFISVAKEMIERFKAAQLILDFLP